MKKYLLLFSTIINCLNQQKTACTKRLSIIIVLFLFFPSLTKAQVFNGSGGPILNTGQTTYFNLLVSGLVPAQLDSTFGVESVCINLNHPTDEELYIYLESPNGRIVELAPGSSCNGVNYTNTCFDSRVSTSITMAVAPYTGTFKPTGYLGRFNNGQTGNGTWRLWVHDYLAFINSGTLISWSLNFGNSPSKPVIFTSSNLPIVFINTGNLTITDSDILVNMGIIDNGSGQRNDTSDSRNNYNGKTMIRIRGNTSRNFEKKSFALETTDMSGVELNASLLGMPPESDWVLTASYTDKSMMRNTMAYDLFRQMGNYAPRTKDVEFVLNNEYRGIYALTEKPKRSDDRINVSKLTPDENSYPEITGGYILKIDRPDEDGWYSLFGGNAQNNSSFYYQYVYPKDIVITVPQKNYINNFMDSLETALNSPTFADPTIGYQKYIDVESFIDFFIMNELSKNVDAYRLSTYLYKDNISHGGKLHIGPVWDYDIAWHNCNYGNSQSPSGWEYQLPDTVHPSPVWWSRLLQDSNFTNKLYCRWKVLRASLLDLNYLNNYIDVQSNWLNEAQQRNFTQWPILGAFIAPNPQVQLNANYSGEVTDLKNWIANRIPWLDSHILGSSCNVGIQEEEPSEVSMNSFPNPFTNNLSVIYKVPDNLSSNTQAKVKIELLNVLGEQVQVLFEGNKVAGTYQEDIATAQLATGIYIVKLSVNNLVVYQKTVKLQEQ
ncbi:MAG: CotH kinase family protein [Bacteroidota bacterium]|nr:CotH kinase family protein [Bacteroidota bacterium]